MAAACIDNVIGYARNREVAYDPNDQENEVSRISRTKKGITR